MLLLLLSIATNCLAGQRDFKKAVLLFDAMEYRQALPLFLSEIESGNLTKKRRVLARQYLAEIYVGLRQNDHAIEQYRALLRIDPDYSPTSDSSPAILSAFNTARTKERTIDTVPELGKEPQPTISINKQIGWGLVGTGGGLIVLGSVGYILADQEHRIYTGTDDEDTANTARSSGQTYEIIGMTGLGLGVVSTGIGIYFLVTESKRKKTGSITNNIHFDFFTTGQKHFGFLAYQW